MTPFHKREDFSGREIFCLKPVGFGVNKTDHLGDVYLEDHPSFNMRGNRGDRKSLGLFPWPFDGL